MKPKTNEKKHTNLGDACINHMTIKNKHASKIPNQLGI